MTQINAIFLDLDDVCNICTMWSLAKVGCPVDENDLDAFPDVGWNICEAANRLHPTKHDWDSDTYWSQFKRADWESIPVSPDFDWLLDQCVELVGTDIYIATAPVECAECLAGKLSFIQQHFPPWMRSQYVITSHKWLLSTPGALLIDDRGLNAHLFENRPDGKPGGRSLLVPRPWNGMRGVNSRSYLETVFERLHMNQQLPG